MTKYFKTFKKGKKHGLPRPMVQLDDYFLNNFSEGLYKNNPVPWQSTPIFNEKGNIFYVIEENEKRVLPEGLCGYCSIKFFFLDINSCIKTSFSFSLNMGMGTIKSISLKRLLNFKLSPINFPK